MSVGQITASQTTTDVSSTRATAMKQFKADFNSLSEALSSGDLAGAQKAFAALQNDKPAGGPHTHRHQGGSGGASAAGGSTNDPFAAIGKALQSGDLQAAQSAFAQIQSAAKARSSSPAQKNDGDGDDQGSFNSSGGKLELSA